MPATERLEFRVAPAVKTRLELAAELVDEPLGKFVRSAAEERANEILAAEQETVVSPAFFDELLAALDKPAERNDAMVEAARLRKKIVVSD